MNLENPGPGGLWPSRKKLNGFLNSYSGQGIAAHSRSSLPQGATLRPAFPILQRRAAWLILAAGLTGGAAAAQDITTCLPPVAPILSSAVPGDTPVNDQASLNCFAWQQFIALNWPAEAMGQPADAPATEFGMAGDPRPTVWETYPNAHEIFLPDGAMPPPWGAETPVPAACQPVGTDRRFLQHSSKFSAIFDLPEDVNEAAPGGTPNWLADRDGNPVLYEILTNRDEYDYIRQSGFYSATAQASALKAGTHIDAPRGVLGGAVGSIELKAAWLVIPDPDDPRWRGYRLSGAAVYDPATGSCTDRTVALAGLHIMHKTESNPQWIWASFEHVDNAPDIAEVTAGTVEDRFRFFDAACTPQPIPQACFSQQVPGCSNPQPVAQTSCTVNQPPAHCLALGNPDCPPSPVQVARVTPIEDSGDNLVATLNAEVQQMIRDKAGADSVWQNYRLIGVLWSGAPVDQSLPGSSPATGQLSVSGIRPPPAAQPLANAVLETYVQNSTCVACHRGAQGAGAGKDGLPGFTSDYSFQFGKARPGQ